MSHLVVMFLLCEPRVIRRCSASVRTPNVCSACAGLSICGFAGSQHSPPRSPSRSTSPESVCHVVSSQCFRACVPRLQQAATDPSQHPMCVMHELEFSCLSLQPRSSFVFLSLVEEHSPLLTPCGWCCCCVCARARCAQELLFCHARANVAAASKAAHAMRTL